MLTTIDPNFGLLPKAEQDKVFGAPAASTQPYQFKWPGAVSAPMYNKDGVMASKDVPMSPLEDAAMAPLSLLRGGAEQAGEGYTQVLHPQDADDFASGLANSALGTGTLMLPFFAPAMAAHPLATAIGLGTGAATGGLAEGGLDMLGASPGFSKLGGVIAGGVAGWKAGEAEEAVKARLADLWNKPGMKSALADLIPVWGSKAGYGEKLTKIAKIGIKTPPSKFPAMPSFLDDDIYTNPPNRDAYRVAPMPGPPPVKIPISEMRLGVGASQGEGMEYGGEPPKPPKAKPAPKPKAISKEEQVSNDRIREFGYGLREPKYTPEPPDIPSRPSNMFPRPAEYPPAFEPRSNYHPPEPGAPGLPPPPRQPSFRPAPPDVPSTPSTMPRTGPPPLMDYEVPPPRMTPPPAGEESVGNEYQPKPKAQLPKTPEEIDAAVKKASADREAKLKTVAPELSAGERVAVMPPPPEGSVIVSPAAGMHPDYTGMIAEYGTAGAETAMAKDIKIAAHLKAQGIKPEQWNDLTLAEKNVYVGQAGKYRALGKGGARGRSAEDGAKHIYNRLVELWK